jgi:hypothetical protein
MRMKKIQLVLLFSSLSLCLHAQSLTPFVISSSGAFYSNGSGMLSTTIGELAAINTLTGGSNILTQGFQQAWDFGNSVPEIQENGFASQVYPNPSNGIFTIAMNTDKNFKVNVKVFDVLGKMIYNESLNHSAGYATHEIDLKLIAEGVYFLELINEELSSGKLLKSTQKINIAY